MVRKKPLGFGTMSSNVGALVWSGSGWEVAGLGGAEVVVEKGS